MFYTAYSHSFLMNAGKRGLERQPARRAADKHLLGVLGDGPVLGRSVPVGKVTAGESRLPYDLLARREVKTVKFAQSNHWLVGATKRNVLLMCISQSAQPKAWRTRGALTYQLRDLVTGYLAGVSDDSRDFEKLIVETRVTT